MWDLPSDSVDKTLPCYVGGMGLIPCWGTKTLSNKKKNKHQSWS